MGRTLAIGDIHGCSTAFAALLELLVPTADDTLVLLGDFVDRGPDARGVLEEVLALSESCHLAPLLGNHEEMMLFHLAYESDQSGWLYHGGLETLASYHPEATIDAVPREHIDFMENFCLPYFETERHFFVHANYLHDRPLEDQPIEVLRWESLKARIPPRHVSGKTAIVGHTAQRDGEILDLGHLKCIDTYCYGGGWLTALDVDTSQIWQVDRHGRLRAARPSKRA